MNTEDAVVLGILVGVLLTAAFFMYGPPAGATVNIGTDCNWEQHRCDLSGEVSDMGDADEILILVEDGEAYRLSESTSFSYGDAVPPGSVVTVYEVEGEYFEEIETIEAPSNRFEDRDTDE